jgi:DHA1 family quinolone resistance protein-like MFS transporter
MTYSDVLMLSGWGLVNPILAIFITEQIDGGTVVLAGFASTTYLLVKSILQIPVARFIDLKRGERDDYWVMIVGSVLISVTAFAFMFASAPWHVIAIQVISGIGGALSYPSWQSIFTKHLDKREEGLEWSLYFTATDLGAAMAASVGAVVAYIYGYQMLFWVVGVMSVMGTLFLAGVFSGMRKRG